MHAQWLLRPAGCALPASHAQLQLHQWDPSQLTAAPPSQAPQQARTQQPPQPLPQPSAQQQAPQPAPAPAPCSCTDIPPPGSDSCQKEVRLVRGVCLSSVGRHCTACRPGHGRSPLAWAAPRRKCCPLDPSCTHCAARRGPLLRCRPPGGPALPDDVRPLHLPLRLRVHRYPALRGPHLPSAGGVGQGEGGARKAALHTHGARLPSAYVAAACAAHCGMARHALALCSIRPFRLDPAQPYVQCNEPWMASFCQFSCGRCPCSTAPPPAAAAPSPTPPPAAQPAVAPPPPLSSPTDPAEAQSFGELGALLSQPSAAPGGQPASAGGGAAGQAPPAATPAPAPAPPPCRTDVQGYLRWVGVVLCCAHACLVPGFT